MQVLTSVYFASTMTDNRVGIHMSFESSNAVYGHPESQRLQFVHHGIQVCISSSGQLFKIAILLTQPRRKERS